MSESARERARRLAEQSSVGPGAPPPDPEEVDAVVERLAKLMEDEDQ